MNRPIAFALGLATLAAVAVPTSPADARDGCGRGYYFDGHRCRVQGGGHYAAPPRYYGGGGYYAQPRAQYYGRPYPSMGANGLISCNHPHYTWQNGACKPYRGP